MTKEISKDKSGRNWLIKALSIFYVVYICYFIISYFAAPQQVVVGLIALSAIFVTLIQVSAATARLSPWLSGGITTLLVLLWLFVGLYFNLEYPSLLYERDGANTTLDFFLAGLLIVLTIIYTYICYGLTIPLVVTMFLIYGIFGQYFPGFLYHPGMRLERLLQETSLSFSGIFGLLPQVGLKYVAIFIIFAGFVNVFGGMDYVIYMVRRLSRKNERMIPQISVLSSMAFGSFTGSAAANLAGTGAFTIPLMKKHGIPPKVAGGVEAAVKKLAAELGEYGIGFEKLASPFKQDTGIKGKTTYMGVEWWGWHFGSHVRAADAYTYVKAMFSPEAQAVFKKGHKFLAGIANPKFAYKMQAKGVNAVKSVPVHPGVSKYLKEVGAWQDDWQEGK